MHEEAEDVETVRLSGNRQGRGAWQTLHTEKEISQPKPVYSNQLVVSDCDVDTADIPMNLPRGSGYSTLKAL